MKGFEWTGWVKPANQYAIGYHVTGFNFGETGFENYHVDAEGNKSLCDCKQYTEEEAEKLS